MNAPRTQSVMVTIESQLDDTVLVAMAIRGLCALTSLTQKEINHVELCVVEVVNNAIEHAYHYQEGKKVEIEFSLVPEQHLKICVIDSGKKISVPLSDVLKSKPQMDPNDPTTWQCSGRGLALVDRIMDTISYSSNAGKNHFCMLRSLR